MNKTLIFFNTHIINEAIITEFKKILGIDGYDVILSLDNSSNKFSQDSDNHIQELEFYGEKYKCFLYDENVHKSLNLPYYSCCKKNTFKEVMWINGDYRFYYIRKYFPQYDYYWYIEYDVFCNGKSYKPFLDKFVGSSADLIIQEKDKSPIEHSEQWYWYRNTDWVYKDVKKYRSFYPVLRLSSKAIDFLYKKRLEHTELYSQIEDKKSNQWIFCELFTPTELINNGFSCSYFDENLYYTPEFDLNDTRIFEHPDDRLYHPVKGNFIERLKNLKNENKNLKRQLKELEYFKINILGIKIKIKRNKNQ